MNDIIATDTQPASYQSIEPAIDPTNRPTFLLDWELTLKCNLDCSYCGTGEDGGHSLTADFPPVEQCYDSINFMFQYVDLYMKYKPKWTRAVVLNIYGGESLLHPDIVPILKRVWETYQPYKDYWSLKITCTTNAVIGKNRMQEIIPLIQEFTVSYHCESMDKQKKQMLDNILLLKQNNKDTKVIVLMHSDHKHWQELFDVIDFCKSNNIAYIERQLDGSLHENYNEEQIAWFKNLYTQRTPAGAKQKQSEMLGSNQFYKDSDAVQLSAVGRSCCGGRNLCVDQDLRLPVNHVVDNNYKGWYCSVNWFFVYIKQQTRKVYTNKDCRMNLNGEVAPLGSLDDFDAILQDTKHKLETKTMPVIECKKTRCYCGLCAPKAVSKDSFYSIMQKHTTTNCFS